MEKRILSSDLMKYMALFQSITKADLKDCFIDDNSMLTFIVEEGNIGKALGKKAKNIKILEKKLNKRIKVVEFKPEVKSFIKSLLFPLKIQEIAEENDILEITPVDVKTRGIMIGRNASNLRKIEKIVQRFFNVKEIKVKNPNR